MRRGVVTGIGLVGALLATGGVATAQEPRHSVALYGIGAYLDGDLTVGERESAVDVDVDQVLDSLETAAFARYRYGADRWAFVLDGQFAGLGDTVDVGPIRTDLDADLYILQADGAYRFNPTTEALFGVRHVRVETDVVSSWSASATSGKSEPSSTSPAPPSVSGIAPASRATTGTPLASASITNWRLILRPVASATRSTAATAAAAAASERSTWSAR